MALLDFVRRAYSLPRSFLRSFLICNHSPLSSPPKDLHETHQRHAPGPVASLPAYVKVNSTHTHAQYTKEDLDWSKAAFALDDDQNTTEQPISNLKPALSLRQAARLPLEQPQYLLPCEKPRSTAQTMLKRQATLKKLEGNVPMEAGEGTRWYGSTRKERMEERQWMMRRSRIQKGVTMLEERMIGGTIDAMI